jgi:hypothetical protein
MNPLPIAGGKCDKLVATAWRFWAFTRVATVKQGGKNTTICEIVLNSHETLQTLSEIITIVQNSNESLQTSLSKPYC